ncbi:MAG: HAMP domain-containing histidine kinase, partial [Clostridiales bacterium]|nr:HAMP domain-containing histidine kinase [Clostridiales bacterium]
MKFSLKVFFLTVIVIAVATGAGGFYLVNAMFDAALRREIAQALDENDIVRFTLETIAANVPIKYESLQDRVIGEIGATLETGRFLRISDDQKKALYQSAEFQRNTSLINHLDENMRGFMTTKIGGTYFIHTATTAEVMGNLLYLETLKDISTIYTDRENGFAVQRNITVITLSLSAFVLFALSLWLTKPINGLTAVTKDMAAGDYSRRAKKVSDDELGVLTDNFNDMANALEEKICELREESQAKERFVAAFAHELKTPLTAIIGYADMLRSRKLEEDKQFLSADYIFKEGRRLETLSLRLLDIIVLKKTVLILRSVPVSSVFKRIEDGFRIEENYDITFRYDEATVEIETALLTTVLLNLIDNAVKAYDNGGRIEVSGRLLANGYLFSVKDFGCGIAEDDVAKITQAFFMADKSRARKRFSAGLGLT